jgi:hypothetical protein
MAYYVEVTDKQSFQYTFRFRIRVMDYARAQRIADELRAEGYGVMVVAARLEAH